MCIRDRIRKKAYPIAESTAEDAVAKADELLEKMPETDIVFFDLPGTVNSTGVLNTLANMDSVSYTHLPFIYSLLPSAISACSPQVYGSPAFSNRTLWTMCSTTRTKVSCRKQGLSKTNIL